MAGIDIGPAPELLPEPIRDRLIHLERDEYRMGVLGIAKGRFDSEGALRGEVIFPGDRPRRVVEPLRSARVEFTERMEHPHRDSGPQTNAERFVPVRGKADSSAVLANLFRAELSQLIGEQRLGSARGGRKEFGALGHARTLLDW